MSAISLRTKPPVRSSRNSLRVARLMAGNSVGSLRVASSLVGGPELYRSYSQPSRRNRARLSKVEEHIVYGLSATSDPNWRTNRWWAVYRSRLSGQGDGLNIRAPLPELLAAKTGLVYPCPWRRLSLSSSGPCQSGAQSRDVTVHWRSVRAAVSWVGRVTGSGSAT